MQIRKEYSFQRILKTKDTADELNVARDMRKIIHEGEYVCKCPACEFGFVNMYDPVERIGICDNCFEEIKIN